MEGLSSFSIWNLVSDRTVERPAGTFMARVPGGRRPSILKSSTLN